MKRILFFLIFLNLIAGVPLHESRAEEIYGQFPTGLLQLEKKHPYYVYVPEAYSPDKGWPMLFLLGKRGDEPKEIIGSWVDWAKQNQFIVLAPTNVAPEKDVPELADQWLLSVKQEVKERYKIDSARIFLVGLESGAHYAAYLGTRYPQEFSGVVLVGGAWPGSFEKIIKPSSDPDKQVPFYVLMNPKGEGYGAVEAKANEFEKKGYPVTLESLKDVEDISAVRDRLTQWVRKESEARAILKEKPKKTFKQKKDRFLRDFFTI